MKTFWRIFDALRLALAMILLATGIIIMIALLHNSVTHCTGSKCAVVGKK